jgi:hypothetical protein
MLRNFLISFAFLTGALAACEPEVLISDSARSGAYEVVALVAE